MLYVYRININHMFLYGSKNTIRTENYVQDSIHLNKRLYTRKRDTVTINSFAFSPCPKVGNALVSPLCL